MTDENDDGRTDSGAMRALAVSSTYKTRGRIDSSNATGVLGHNTATSGAAFGVEGAVDSTDDSAVGVRGKATSSSSGASGDGVVGTTRGTGTTSSLNSTSIATGVTGGAENDTDAVNTVGVFGYNYSTADGDAGVLGRAYSDDGQVYGVRGGTNSDTNGAAGVWGDANDSSGTVHGVKGSTSSADGYGVYSDGDAGVGGALDVDNVGASVYLGSSQSIPGNDSSRRVAFDSVIADDRGEWSNSNPDHAFVCASAGDYHVDVGIQYADFFGESVSSYASIRADNGNFEIKAEDEDTTPYLNDRGLTGSLSHSFSKTLRGLSADDKIWVTVRQNSGSSKDLAANVQSNAYVTITKVG